MLNTSKIYIFKNFPHFVKSSFLQNIPRAICVCLLFSKNVNTSFLYLFKWYLVGLICITWTRKYSVLKLFWFEMLKNFLSPYLTMIHRFLQLGIVVSNARTSFVFFSESVCQSQAFEKKVNISNDTAFSDSYVLLLSCALQLLYKLQWQTIHICLLFTKKTWFFITNHAMTPRTYI